MHVCKNPIKDSLEIGKYVCSMRWHLSQGDLYLNDIKQGYMRTAVVFLGDNSRTQR